jgi:hypothetical protein
MAISDFFNIPVDVLEPPDPAAVGAWGAPDRKFAKIGSTVGTFEVASAQERQVHGQKGEVVTHKFWLSPPVDFSINHRQRLQVVEAGEITTYQIHTVDNFQQRGHHLTLMVEELRPSEVLTSKQDG